MSEANTKQIGGLHYKAEIQHWDLIEDHGIGYLEGCCTKYLTRWKLKNGVVDLEKSLHYVEKLLEKSGTGRAPRGCVPKEELERFFVANSMGVTERTVTTILCQTWTAESLSSACDLISALIAGVRFQAVTKVR